MPAVFARTLACFTGVYIFVSDRGWQESAESNEPDVTSRTAAGKARCEVGMESATFP
jgi:hypothetical protein